MKESFSQKSLIYKNGFAGALDRILGEKNEPNEQVGNHPQSPLSPVFLDSTKRKKGKRVVWFCVFTFFF
jgi:hypothetical protein